jgi:ribosomal protein S3
MACVLAGVALSTSGCAVLLTGYLIGDGIARSKAVETCRANLKTTNDARIHKGQEPFPDQCGQ